MEIGRVTESRQRSGNCECKSPWHSLKQERGRGRAHYYSSVRCENEEDLKFSYTTRTHTHTLWLPRTPLNWPLFYQLLQSLGQRHSPALCSSFLLRCSSSPCFYPNIQFSPQVFFPKVSFPLSCSHFLELFIYESS